jgi:hypothetical protein
MVYSVHCVWRTRRKNTVELFCSQEERGRKQVEELCR